MSRIIFWLALVFLVIFAIRSKIREAQKRQQQQFRQPPQPDGARPAAKSVADAETMLQCAHCGIFYPASESVQARGRDYCSAAHATLPAA
ncbi:PP0621 family protein [Rugamonas rivuli]|uniref:Uncharacterized protein n=1 Tax=Rugamonas rivuli TaxID=2743358 RepID=A0A843SFZ1_9BURK|nr:PP0621 family protein [Rugamonas rivuli]MQA21388.1 hypothetical protein [Rugamonas rivuli]